jgi:hypothetical protein
VLRGFLGSEPANYLYLMTVKAWNYWKSTRHQNMEMIILWYLIILLIDLMVNSTGNNLVMMICFLLFHSCVHLIETESVLYLLLIPGWYIKSVIVTLITGFTRKKKLLSELMGRPTGQSIWTNHLFYWNNIILFFLKKLIFDINQIKFKLNLWKLIEFI